MKKRVLPFILSVLILFSCLPTALADDEPQETAQPQFTETPEPLPEPTVIPEPAIEPSPEPTAIPEPAPESSAEPTVEPEPSPEPVMQPEEAMLPQSESEAYIVNATSGDYEYSVNADGISATITKYYGAGGDVTIPAKLDGYTVTELGNYLFFNNVSIEHVIIPDSITTIGFNTFGGTRLRNISIPASVECIKDGGIGSSYLTSIDVNVDNPNYSSQDGVLFDKLKLKLMQYPSNNGRISYEIPDSVKEICNWGFCECNNLNSISIPDGVETIGKGTFSYCDNLESIFIPESVTYIDEDRTFELCSSLAAINVDANNDSYTSKEGVLFNKEMTRMIKYPCSKADINYTIPANVTEIIDYAFEFTHYLKSITITDNVQSIGMLQWVESLTDINVETGNDYFSSQDGVLFDKDKYRLLKYPEGKVANGYVIPSSVTEIGRAAFANSWIESIEIPSSVTLIGDSSFNQCFRLSYIKFPENLSSLGDWVFRDCAELSVACFTGNAPTVGYDIFYACKPGFKIRYKSGTTGYTNPWHGYPAAEYDPSASLNITFKSIDNSIFYFSKALFGTVITKPSDPERFGYTLDGWYMTDKYEGNPISFPFVLTEDITLFAKWIPKICYIYFDSGWGWNNTYVYTKFNSFISAPSEPAKDGYAFAGWYTTSSCDTAPVTFPYTVKGDAILYAKWIAYEYTVSFESMGGSFIPEVRAAYNTTISEPVPPVRSGYSIFGWYPTPACDTTPITFPYTVKGNTVLYAKWQPVGMKPIPTPSGIPSPYLAGVNYSAGSISRAFAKTVFSYKLLLGENEGGVTLSPAKDFNGAVMTINGKAVPSYTVDLANGKSAKISVKVKYGKTSKTYTFTVTRMKSTNNALSSLSASAGTWSQPFDPGVTNYTLSLDENTKSVAIKAAAAAGKLAGVSPSSKKITLNNGQSKTVKITVKAQSGARRIYTITVVRAASTNADLKSLKAPGLSPAFSPKITSYAVTLPANKGAFTVSAKAAGYKASIYIDGVKKSSKSIALANGQTVVVIVKVVSQAGSEREYAVTVTRQ